MTELLLNVIAAIAVGVSAYAFAVWYVDTASMTPTRARRGRASLSPHSDWGSPRFRPPTWILFTIRVLVILFFCALLGTAEGLLGP